MDDDGSFLGSGGGVQGGYDDRERLMLLLLLLVNRTTRFCIDSFRLSLFIRCWPIDDHSRTNHGA